MLIGLLSLSACATQVVPVGDWGRPADLHLTESSLKGVKVAIYCARQDDEEKIHGRMMPVCSALARQLQAIGANILIDDERVMKGQERVDLTLWYIEHGTKGVQSSGLANVGYILTGGISPWITATTVSAELRVTDGRGVVLDRAKVQVEDIWITGWGALLAYNQKSQYQQKSEIGAKFFRFAQNRVVSQARHLKLATAASAPATGRAEP